jgi:hypothetical protein
MTLNPLSDKKIIDSWSKNGMPWTTAIREGQIESRKLITHHVVIDAVLGRSPKTVFDIGCGEASWHVNSAHKVWTCMALM